MKKLVLIALVIALAMPLAAQDQERVLPYDALLRSAKIYLGQRSPDYKAAIDLLQTAIDNYPDPVEAYYWLGVIRSEKEQYPEMLENFRKFREICARAEDENNKDLKKKCKKDKMPKQIDDIIVSEWEKNFNDGVKNLKMADSLKTEAESAPDDSTRQLYEANVQKLYDKAKEDFNVAVMLDSTEYKAFTNLALVDSRLDNPEGAVQNYEKSLELNPDDPGPLPDLANILYKLGRKQEAVKYYEELADKDSSNAVWALTYAAICYQDLKDRAKLKQTLDRVLEIAPDDDQFHYQRGIFYIQEATSSALQDSIGVLDSLAKANPKNKEMEKAREDLIKYRLDFYRQAMPDFKRAAEIDTNDADYQYWYATSAYFSDDLEAAQKIYEKCTEIDSTYKDCWCGLELVYARLKKPAEYDKAKAKCEEAE